MYNCCTIDLRPSGVQRGRFEKVSYGQKEVVMSESGATREWISLRVKPEEYDLIEKRRQATSCRTLSEYARKLLLSKPVTIKYRNESLDQSMEEMILLKNELNAIGNNFNQAVKRLHTLDTTGQARAWMIAYESTHQAFIRKVEEIKERLNQIDALWSSK